jgi:hypothetical protein
VDRAAGTGVDRVLDTGVDRALGTGAGRVLDPDANMVSVLDPDANMVSVLDPDASMVSVQGLSDPDASMVSVRMCPHRDAHTDGDYRVLIRPPLRMTADQYSSLLLIYCYWGLDIHTLPVSSPMPNTILSLATVIS